MGEPVYDMLERIPLFSRLELSLRDGPLCAVGRGGPLRDSAIPGVAADISGAASAVHRPHLVTTAFTRFPAVGLRDGPLCAVSRGGPLRDSATVVGLVVLVDLVDLHDLVDLVVLFTIGGRYPHESTH